MLQDIGDPSAKDNEAILRAANSGYFEIVKRLLQDPRVDLSAQENFAIRQASYGRFSKIVEILLFDPRVDPRANKNFALRYALRKGGLDIADLLKDVRVDGKAFLRLHIKQWSERMVDFVSKVIEEGTILNSPQNVAFKVTNQ